MDCRDVYLEMLTRGLSYFFALSFSLSAEIKSLKHESMVSLYARKHVPSSPTACYRTLSGPSGARSVPESLPENGGVRGSVLRSVSLRSVQDVSQEVARDPRDTPWDTPLTPVLGDTLGETLGQMGPRHSCSKRGRCFCCGTIMIAPF